LEPLILSDPLNYPPVLMPDSPATPKPPRSVRALDRWGLGGLAIIQITLAFIAFIALNYLAFHQYGRADLSRTADYTLSPATKSLLVSPALKDRESPVRWILSFRRTTPFYERVRAIAEEYVRISKGAITLEIVDPLRSPDRMQEITATYGLTLVRDMLIIDGRSDESPAIREDANQIKSLHPHIRLVLAEDLATYSVDGGKRKISAFRGEDILTSRLIEAIEGKPKRMALIADKTRLRHDVENSSLKSLADRLRLQNIDLIELAISTTPEIPEDITGLIIASPSFDFTESEMATVERFWTRPRAALLVLSDSNGVPSRLKTFLRAHGITPQKDRVVQPKDKGITTEVAATFTQGIPFLGGLAGQSTTFEGATASLEVREGAEDLLTKKIYPIGILEAASDAWGETRFGDGKEAFDETEDRPAPFHLAATVTRGAEMDDRFAESTARMAVISNTDFLSPARSTRAENFDFLHSALHWLVGREAPVGIGPRELRNYKLPLLNAQVSFINRVNLIFLPAALLLIGGFVWSSRRV
jgi:hypothetical protein